MQRGTDMQERNGLWQVNAARKRMSCSVSSACAYMGRHTGYYRHINEGRLGVQKYRSPATGHSSFAISPIPIRQAGSSLPYVSLEWRKIVDSCYLHAIRAEVAVPWVRGILVS
jgi:hypothetical protein